MKRRAFLRAAPVIGVAGCLENAEVGRRDGRGGTTDSADSVRREASSGRFDDFEDLSRWNVLEPSLSADTDRQYYGSQSVRLDAAGSDSAVRISREFDPPLDLTGLNVTAALRAVGNSLPRIQLFDADGNRVDFRTRVEGELPFRPFNFGISRVEGDPDLSAVTELRIVHWAGSDSSRTLWVDDLRFVSPSETGRVHVSFDDTAETDYTTAFPVLDEYDYPATSFVNPRYVGKDGKLSIEQLRDLQGAGWEIGSHAWSHVKLPKLDEARQNAEIGDAKEWLVEHGFERGADFFAYPYAEYDRTTLELVDRHHEFGFVGGYPAFGPVTDPLLVHRVGGNLSVEDARRAIDLAAEYGGITSIFYHLLEGDHVEAFEETMAYLHERESAGDVEVVSARDLAP